MSLIIEDGTSLPDADSYISVLDADAYHARRGNAAWALLDEPAKEQALLRACDYMAQAYRGAWKGYRTLTTQALDWPRQGVQLFDMAIAYTLQFNLIPNEVRHAQAELALRASAAVLAPDLERGVIAESVGAVSVTYDRATPQQTRFRSTDLMLAHLMGSHGISVQLVRT